NGSRWSTPRVVDPNGKTGYYPSIVFNSNNVANISYFEKATDSHSNPIGSLRLAFVTDTTIQVNIIEGGAGTGDPGRYSSIQLEPGVGWAISYQAAIVGELRYWKQSYSSHVRVDPSDGVGGYTSLAFDSSGKPAIAYSHSTATQVRFAKYDGTNWNLTSISGDRGYYERFWYNGSTPRV